MNRAQFAALAKPLPITLQDNHFDISPCLFRPGNVGWSIGQHVRITNVGDRPLQPFLQLHVTVAGSRHWAPEERVELSPPQPRQQISYSIPFTLIEFRESAGPIELRVADQSVTLRPQEFNTGGVGWSGSLSMSHSLNGQAVSCYANAVLRIVGAANHFRGEAEAAAAIGGNDLDLAKRDYSEAIDREPENDAAYYGRALVHFAKRDWDAASADLNHALALNAKHARAWHARACLCCVLVDWTGAIEDANRALEIDDNFIEALQLRAYAYYRRGKAGNADGPG